MGVEKTTQCGAEHSVRLTQYCSGDDIQKKEMGDVCSAYVVEAYTGFWRGNLRERDRLGDPGVDGGIFFTAAIIRAFRHGLLQQ
jgi:hypothetical protein